jgi:AcrR family transcriptional regulator
VLLAARQIVEESGAGALTYDELSRVSEVTRGGITYHFPTKDALLKALLEDDMQQWKASEASLSPTDCKDPALAELIGFIRSHTSLDDSRRRFVAGMLSAAVHQPELLASCRDEISSRYVDQSWDEASLRNHVLRLAAVGLFWEELFDIRSLPSSVRPKLVAMLEQLASTGSATASEKAPSR